MKKLILVAMAVGLAGCQQVRGTGEQGLSDLEIDAKDNATCRSFGAVPGSQPFIDCRLRLRSDRSSEDRARRLRAML